MLDFLGKAVSSLFGGNKSQKELKAVTPRIKEINEEFERLQGLTNDELRAKTLEFRARIQAGIKDITDKTEEFRCRIDTEPDMDAEEKENLFRQIDSLKKDKNQQIEKELNSILNEV